MHAPEPFLFFMHLPICYTNPWWVQQSLTNKPTSPISRQTFKFLGIREAFQVAQETQNCFWNWGMSRVFCNKKLTSAGLDDEIPLKIGMLQVLAFVESRLRNEQAPVVDAVLATISSDSLPVELWQPEDAPHLETLRDNAVDANDATSSARRSLAALALRIVKRRLRVCRNPNNDTLLHSTMTMLYRYAV